MENKLKNTQNTIFILGSDASNFLGYPLLSQLRHDSLKVLYDEIIVCIEKENLLVDKLDTKKNINDLYNKFENNEINDLEFLKGIEKIIFQLEKDNKLQIIHCAFNKNYGPVNCSLSKQYFKN